MKETQQNQLNEEEVNRFEQLNEEIAKATVIF